MGKSRKGGFPSLAWRFAQTPNGGPAAILENRWLTFVRSVKVRGCAWWSGRAGCVWPSRASAVQSGGGETRDCRNESKGRRKVNGSEQIEEVKGQFDYDCPLCEDRRWVSGSVLRLMGANGQPYERPGPLRPCECVVKRKGPKLLDAARIPALFASATFANYDVSAHPSQQRARMMAMRYIDEWRTMEGRGLLFSGNCGAGKSHLMAAMVRELTLTHHVSCAFVPVKEFLRDRRDEVSRNQVDSETRRILGVDILMLDDLGSERMTDYSKEVVSQIISERYNRGLPIVVSSNNPLGPPADVEDDYVETADEAALAAERGTPAAIDRKKEKFKKVITLGDRLGARSYSRLEGMCNVVPVMGPDRRKMR